jgi:hypothetical protein
LIVDLCIHSYYEGFKPFTSNFLLSPKERSGSIS